MPKLILNGKEMSDIVSDYVAMNGRYMARVMKGDGEYKKPKSFRSGVFELGGFWRLFAFMCRSILTQVPGAETKGDELKFVEPANVSVQAEGEKIELKNVHRIEIRKSQKYLKAIVL